VRLAIAGDSVGLAYSEFELSSPYARLGWNFSGSGTQRARRTPSYLRIRGFPGIRSSSGENWDF
jgi:hypothetical protein